MTAHVGGDVAEGFGHVVDAFRRNFDRRGDVGAALAVFRDGAPLVDLWGGLRDPARGLPWKRNTLVPVFSATRGVAALVMATLRSRGLLDWDAPVAAYWPEFADGGKGAVTVRQLMNHQAGLAGHWPVWKPGTRHGYRSTRLGLCQNELARRVDPRGRTIGRILAEDIAGPMGLSVYIGLPAEVPMDRVAVLGRLPVRDALRQLPGVPWRLAVGLLVRRGPVRSLTGPRLGAAERFSRREVLTPEAPSSNGVAEARGLARLYCAAAVGSPELPIDAGTLAELAAPTDAAARTDLLLKAKAACSYGFSRPTRAHPFGSPGMRSFGSPGLGGAFAFADPDARVGYAWTPNRLGVRLRDDPREVAVRRAVYRALG